MHSDVKQFKPFFLLRRELTFFDIGRKQKTKQKDDAKDVEASYVYVSPVSSATNGQLL
jgi:hypothetical protein